METTKVAADHILLLLGTGIFFIIPPPTWLWVIYLFSWVVLRFDLIYPDFSHNLFLQLAD